MVQPDCYARRLSEYRNSSSSNTSGILYIPHFYWKGKVDVKKGVSLCLSLLVAPVGIFSEALYWSCCQVSTGAIAYAQNNSRLIKCVHDCEVINIQRKWPLLHT